VSKLPDVSEELFNQLSFPNFAFDLALTELDFLVESLRAWKGQSALSNYRLFRHRGRVILSDKDLSKVVPTIPYSLFLVGKETTETANQLDVFLFDGHVWQPATYAWAATDHYGLGSLAVFDIDLEKLAQYEYHQEAH